jgi:hypothetical protein
MIYNLKMKQTNLAHKTNNLSEESDVKKTGGHTLAACLLTYFRTRYGRDLRDITRRTKNS